MFFTREFFLQRVFARGAVCMLALWVVLSCVSTADKAGRTAAPELTPEEQKKLAEYKAETEIGRNMAGRLLAFYGPVEDAKLVAYVNQVGAYVAQNSDFQDRRYMFNILDNDKANAFACPGGYILITKGALALAENESELAMILAHEVSHVGRRHIFNTLKSMNEKDLEAAADAAEKKTNLPESMMMRKREEPAKGTGFGSNIGKVLAGGGASPIGIFKAASAGMGVLLEKGLDKKLEFEADYDGVKFATRAGYHPDGLRQFLKRLESKKDVMYSKVLADTHPTTQDRVSRIAKELEEMNAAEIIGATGQERFKKMTSSIVTNSKNQKVEKVAKSEKKVKPEKTEKKSEKKVEKKAEEKK